MTGVIYFYPVSISAEGSMRMSGWVRLWLLLVLIWVPLVAWQFSADLETPSRLNDMVAMAAVALAVPVFALLVGLVLAWVWRRVSS
jgi:hypothetical protein